MRLTMAQCRDEAGGICRWLLVPRHLIVSGAALLALLYTMSYLSFNALPGNVPQFPLGWWGWFDQSKTLESARALASRDFSPGHHWYPLGYSVLGALFSRTGGAHPFFFVDLALLLSAYAGFVAFARRAGVPLLLSVPLFLLITAADPRLFQEWIIPWNTTASGAFIWLLLAATASHMSGARKPFWIGLTATAVALCRPTDALFVVPCVIAALIADIRNGRAWLYDAWRFLAGVAILAVPFAALYLRIYGPHPTEYMVMSRQIGFTFYDLGWKAYVILIEPRAWFLDGEGLLRREPWIALSIAGLVPALVRGRGPMLLGVLLLLHAGLYLAYVDLLPTGFWRYNNVHYWNWALPGYGLLAVLLLRDVLRPEVGYRRTIAYASVIVTGAVLCVHLDPRPATEAEPAKMLDFPAAPLHFEAAYFGNWALHDDASELGNITAVRGIPTTSGMRVIALRRDVAGPVGWVAAPDGWQPGEGPPQRWQIGFSIGLPCWLLRCTGPKLTSLLPPPG